MNKPLPKVEKALMYLINRRRERSIRRALFEQYEKWHVGFMSIEHTYTRIPEESRYDTITPFVVSRCIDDPNLVVKLLRAPLTLSLNPYLSTSLNEYVVFSEDISNNIYSIEDIIWFIKFLKKSYTENEIVNFLLNVEQYPAEWRDTLLYMPIYKSAIKKHFQKVKLTIVNIHDEIVNCAHYIENQVHNSIKFSYGKEYESACRLEGGLEFVLPRTGLTLRNWANTLHNCLDGYVELVAIRHCTIYGVFKDGQLIYVIEIIDREITQMTGKYNANIPDTDSQVVLEWENKYFSTDLDIPFAKI